MSAFGGKADTEPFRIGALPPFEIETGGGKFSVVLSDRRSHSLQRSHLKNSWSGLWTDLVVCGRFKGEPMTASECLYAAAMTVVIVWLLAEISGQALKR